MAVFFKCLKLQLTNEDHIYLKKNNRSDEIPWLIKIFNLSSIYNISKF